MLHNRSSTLYKYINNIVDYDLVLKNTVNNVSKLPTLSKILVSMNLNTKSDSDFIIIKSLNYLSYLTFNKKFTIKNNRNKFYISFNLSGVNIYRFLGLFVDFFQYQILKKYLYFKYGLDSQGNVVFSYGDLGELALDDLYFDYFKSFSKLNLNFFMINNYNMKKYNFLLVYLSSLKYIK